MADSGGAGRERNPSLTLFACLRPFKGHVGLIQRNAIMSWMLLSPRPEVILFGGDHEAPDVCRELGVRYAPDVARNRWGTELVSDMVDTVQRQISTALVCYVNADIVLMDDFIEAIATVAVSRRKFLVVGQRTDLDVVEPLPFGSPDWQQRLRADALRRGRLHDVWGIDYRVFTRGLLDPMPSFAVGRGSDDNWFVYRARQQGVPVIDATSSVMAIHQNHDYSSHPDGWKGLRQSDEANENLRLAGGHERLFWIDDRTHFLTIEGLRRDLSVAQMRRYWTRLPVLTPPHLQLPLRLLKTGAHIARPLWRPVVDRLSRAQ